jgi:hypothetical protein
MKKSEGHQSQFEIQMELNLCRTRFEYIINNSLESIKHTENLESEIEVLIQRLKNNFNLINSSSKVQ